MNVVLTVAGVVVVDDKLDVVHVEAAGSDICGHEDRRRAVLELAEHPVPLLLLLVAVDAHGGVAVASHQSGQIVGFPLRLNKDQDLVRGLTANLIQEP